MAKRNETPKGSSTQQSRYDIGMTGSVDITGLSEANPTSKSVGRAQNPMGDILDALGRLGSSMKSYNAADKAEQAKDQRARAAAAAGQAGLDSAKAGEEWKTRIDNGDWSSSIPGQGGPTGPDADKRDLETHFLNTVNETLKNGGTLADAFEQEARFHADSWGGNEVDESGNLTIEAQEFNKKFLPEQIKRLGGYYRDVYQAEQKAAIRDGMVETIAFGGDEANGLLGVGPGQGRGREQFGSFMKAMEEDPLLSNISREGGASLLLDGARMAAAEGDYTRADRILKMVPLAGNSSEMRTIRDAFESDYLDIRRTRSLTDFRNFALGPAGGEDAMPEGWLAEAASNTNEQQANAVSTALTEAAQNYPGSVAVQRQHLDSLLQEMDKDGNFVVNRNSPLARAIRQAKDNLPSEAEELDLQSKRMAANKRNALGLSATIVRDGNLGNITFVNEAGDEVQVTEDNFKEYLVDQYGNQGNAYHIDHQKLKAGLAEEGSGDIAAFADFRLQLYNATSLNDREEIWGRIRAGVEAGQFDASQVNGLFAEFKNQSQFDEDKQHPRVREVRTSTQTTFWGALGVEGTVDAEGRFTVAQNVADPNTMRYARPILATAERAMRKEYRKWYSHPEQVEARNSDLAEYRESRQDWLDAQEVRWLGGVSSDPKTGEPIGEYQDGLINKYVEKAVQQANAATGSADNNQPVSANNTGRGQTKVNPPGTKPPGTPTRDDE